MVWSAAIMGGASLLSGLMGANAASDAADANWAINLYNMQQRERERLQQMMAARRLDAEQKLGSTNARGDRVYFDPVRGWVTELSDKSQQMQDLSDEEMLRMLTEDTKLRRDQIRKNEQRKAFDSGMADAAASELYYMDTPSQEELYQTLLAASTHGINDAYDTAQNNAMKQALRSQDGSAGTILAAMASQRAKDIEGATKNARVQALTMAPDMRNNQRAQTTNLYNMFANRAGAMPDVSFTPMNLDASANAMMTPAAQRALSGNAAVVNASGASGGRLNSVEPNYGWASAVGNAGMTIGSALSNYQAGQQQSQQFNRLLDIMASRSGGGGSSDVSFANRYKGNYGRF